MENENQGVIIREGADTKNGAGHAPVKGAWPAGVIQNPFYD